MAEETIVWNSVEAENVDAGMSRAHDARDNG
jgi:hypothetical protein